MTGPVPTHRHLVPTVALVALLVTAGCGSSPSATQSGSGTSASTTPQLGPWQGAFATAAPPTGVQLLRSVACPTATRCWAVGTTVATATTPSTAAMVTTSTGGATWSIQTLPATVGFLTGIACSSVRNCAAVGQVGTGGVGPGAVVSTVNGGATWQLQPVPAGTTDVTAVTCTTGAHCTALADIAGRVTALTTVGVAGPWVAGGALPPTVSTGFSLSCTDAHDCWAVGTSPVDVGHTAGVVVTTADGGTTWALQTVPPGTGALQGIACTPPAPSTSSTTATTQPATATNCTAVGTTATDISAGRSGQGVVLTTTTGGSTWVSDPVTPTSADLLGVSCGAGPCVAVGTTVASADEAGVAVLTTAPGATSTAWRRSLVVPVPLPLSGITCQSLSACVAVGESVTAHLTTG